MMLQMLRPRMMWHGSLKEAPVLSRDFGSDAALSLKALCNVMHTLEEEVFPASHMR